MIALKLKGIEGANNMLMQLKSEKIPSATRNALNDTAFGLKNHLQNLMKTTFPTANPATVKNIFVAKATNTNLNARVRFDQIYRKGLDEYMLPLIGGGSRSKKPSEVRFGSFLVPATKVNPAIVNKYGNIRGGTMMQVLSQLSKMETLAGAMQNITARSAARMRGTRKTLEYFMVPSGQTRGGLKPGVYQRTAKGVGFGAKTKAGMARGAFQKGQTSGGISSVIRGRGAKPLFIFTKSNPTYTPMLPFFTSGQEYVLKRLPEDISKQVGLYIGKGFGR